MSTHIHPLDSWFNEKTTVRRAGLQAKLIDEDWIEFLCRRCEWSPEEVFLVRSLLRPSDREIEWFLDDMDRDGTQLSPTVLAAWHRPVKDYWKGCSLSVVEPRGLFRFTFDIERGPGFSGSWGYGALQFVPEWAIFCEFGDEGPFVDIEPPGEGFDMLPRGFIETSHPFQSAALLLSEQPEHSDYFGGNELGCATLIRGTSDPIELYRLLLAASGHGTDEVLQMDPAQLKEYRAPGTRCGFPAVEQIFHS
jgi:hypothetical protein